MSTIKVLVHEQSLRVIEGPKIASRGVNENYIKFMFDSSWTGFGKVAIFYMEEDEDNVYQSAIDNNDKAIIPWEVTALDGKLCFGVAGTKDNIIYTSEIVKYNIVRGVPVSGSESEPPSPTIYQQMLLLVGQVQQEFRTAQNNIDILVSQMDEFISDHAGVYGETLIYDASVTGVYLFGDGQDVEPLNDINIRQNVFDFLDIYYIFNGSGYVFTKDYRNYNTEHVYVHAMSTNAVATNITFAQMELVLSGKHIRVVTATRTNWTASTGPTIINVDDDYVAQDPSDYPAGYVKKIIGRKLVGDAELVDARVGVDGTVYQTVGEAIRSQIDDVVGGAVELDTTLTQQGKAAEAKAVGDKIGEVKADLGDLSELETETKTDLVSAINEAAQSGGSGDVLSLAQRQTLINFVNSIGASFTAANAQSVIDDFNDAWDISVTGISLNKSTLAFSGYGLETLEATLSPVGAVGTITWLSSDTSVATVTSNGTVEALGNGTCTITVSCGGYAATCSVTVSGIVATYTVTNSLTGCSTNNDTARVNHGSSYAATISIDIGYVSPFASASITMGGTDITSTAWSNGSVNIAEVTGDVVITVAATQDTRELLYGWDFKTSLIDSVNGIEISLANSNSGESVPTRDSNGLHFTAAEQVAIANLGTINWKTFQGRSYELDIASAQFAGTSNKHKRLLMLNDRGIMIFRNESGLYLYPNAWKQYTAETGKTIPTTTNDFSGKTVKVLLSNDFSAKLYIDGELIGTITGVASAHGVITGNKKIVIGGMASGTQADGNQIYNMTITGLRIYQEEAVET